MASAPHDPSPVVGRVDRNGRLVEADEPLRVLQEEAGSALGSPLALPQLAAIARSALKLGVPMSRSVIAAAADHDLDLWVRAEPDDEGVKLTIEGWAQRPPAPPRLTLVAGGKLSDGEAATASDQFLFEADEELRFTSVSEPLLQLLGGGRIVGQPMTRFFQLVEGSDGMMPLLMALGARHDFRDQKVRLKTPQDGGATLSGKAQAGKAGKFGGFVVTVQFDDLAEATGGDVMFDPAIDDVLRSPLDQIITAADRIVERTDGPLRSDYASYASDIAAAGRHLLSVLRSMNDEEASGEPGIVDVAELAREAAGLVVADAENRGVSVDVEDSGSLSARGEARGILQIMVNILGNAVRHSPAGERVELSFRQGDHRISVTIADHGPGIATADQERIFEKYERGERPGSAGLGLAISRRLARSMGGDVLLESAPGEGARFILVLPKA